MIHDFGDMQFRVRVDRPDPVFALSLRQAIGGARGKIRIATQYAAQATAVRGDAGLRDLLLMTAAEELSHAEILAHAVALNLDGVRGAVVGPADADLSPAIPAKAAGHPVEMGIVQATGDPAADMMANVAAEAGALRLAARLHDMTDDGGMREMLAFLVARDRMHLEQWLAAMARLGVREGPPPIPTAPPGPRDAGAPIGR